MWTRAGRALVCAAALAVAGAGCTRAIDPALVEDAHTAMRVKTALVNDPTLGPRAIEVRVRGGVARLSGVVASRDEATRAVTLARGVAGVTSVESDLQVRPVERERAALEAARLAPEAEPDALDSEGAPGLFAVGLAVSPRRSADARLDADWRVTALVRFGSGSGLSPALAFSWFGADLLPASPVAPADAVGRLSIKPVMGGVRYTVRRGRQSADVSLVGGLAFNSLTLETLPAGEPVPVSVGNSFAWRPGASFWFDASRRIALNLFVGYVVTRPRVTWLEDERLATRRLRGDTVLVSIGAAYKVF